MNDNWSQAGLTETEAAASRARFGENRLTGRKRKSFVRRFLESFGDPLIKILMVALAINLIFLFRDAKWFESAGIAAAILLATFVSTLSEYGSESAFERLQEESSRINCRVYRDGVLREIPVTQVVVGDVAALSAGDRVPADGVIISGRLEVDQSNLNGESKEAVKRAEIAIPRFTYNIEAENRECTNAFSANESVYVKRNCDGTGSPEPADVSDFKNPALLFQSSVVCAGQGLLLVKRVGDNTVYGKIGKEIQEEKRDSPLKERLGKLAGSIGVFGYIAAAVTMLAYFFNVIVLDNRFNLSQMTALVTNPSLMAAHFMKAATLAVTVIVMAVPEGLPMMITVVLSANMRRMLKDNVLVRKLVGIETAGSIAILFTDKTGTLTRGKLRVTHFIPGSRHLYRSKDFGNIPEGLRLILRNAVCHNSAAVISGHTAIGGNATDRAALEFADSLGGGRPFRHVHTIPFTSDTKFMATTVTDAAGYNATFIKGAPEKILPFCTGCFDDAGNANPSIQIKALEGVASELSSQAVRVIAVAVSAAPVPSDGAFKDLIFVGFLGIRDEIRKEAAEAVRVIQNAGIQTVMITGDSKLTAKAVAHETGIIRDPSDLVITSQELARMSDKALAQALPSLRVVARALPSDKSRLIRAAQSLGLVTGMTGDGVNDAPALKQADVGFSMGGGTEVAKEAGDIVILDDNIASIASAVCYGRTIFKSIRKFIIYQLSICMCAVGVTVAGPLLGVDFPITVIQMLWINIVMDTLAGLAFSGEIARRKYMAEPPKLRDERIINPYMYGQIAVTSVYTTVLCLFFLKSPLTVAVFGARGGVYMMTAFFALFMFTAIFTSFNARTHKINLLDYLAANKPFIWIMSAVTVIQICIIYLGGPVFRTAGLLPRHLALIVLMAFTTIPVDLLRKYILSKFPGYSGT